MSGKSVNKTSDTVSRTSNFKKGVKAAAKKTSTYCDLCKVEVSSKTNFEVHLQGRKHKSKAKLKDRLCKKNERLAKTVEHKEAASENSSNATKNHSQSDQGVSQNHMPSFNMPSHPDAFYSEYTSRYSSSSKHSNEFRRNYHDYYKESYPDSFNYRQYYAHYSQPEQCQHWNDSYKFPNYSQMNEDRNFEFPSYEVKLKATNSYSHSRNTSSYNMVRKDKYFSESINFDHNENSQSRNTSVYNIIRKDKCFNNQSNLDNNENTQSRKTSSYNIIPKEKIITDHANLDYNKNTHSRKISSCNMVQTDKCFSDHINLDHTKNSNSRTTSDYTVVRKSKCISNYVNLEHNENSHSRRTLDYNVMQNDKCFSDCVNIDHNESFTEDVEISQKVSENEAIAPKSDCMQDSEGISNIRSGPDVQGIHKTNTAIKVSENHEVKQTALLSCGPVDCNKGKDKKDTLVDAVSGRIARLINPCNHKDKAQLSHLMTEFSKSKKKLNLSKLMHSELKTLNDDIREVYTESSKKATENLSERSKFITNDSHLESHINTCETIATKIAESAIIELNREQSLKGTKCKPLKENIQISNKSSAKKCKAGKNMRKKDHPFSKHDKYLPMKRNSQENAFDNHNAVKKFKRKPSNFRASTVKRKKNIPKISEAKKHQPELQYNFIDAAVLNISEPIHEASASSKQEQNRKEEESLQTDDCTALKNAGGMLTSDEPTKSSSFNGISVESLISLFASGDVKLKKEFDDPAIDAIKTVAPEDLVSACFDSHSVTKINNMEISSCSENPDISQRNLNCDSNNIDHGVNILNCSSMNISNSSHTFAVNDNLNSDNVPYKNASISTSSENDVNMESFNKAGNSISVVLTEKESFSSSPNLKSPPVLADLVKELKDISSREEKVKEDLQNAKEKIHEYQVLLEEWKMKKKQLQNVEEDLRKKRNTVIKTMHDIVGTKNCVTADKLPIVTNSSDADNMLQNVIKTAQNIDARSYESEHQIVQDTSLAKDDIEGSVHHISSSEKDKHEMQLEKNIETLGSDQEDVYVITNPDVDKTKEITIVDLESESEYGTDETQAFENSFLNEDQNSLDVQNITGHSASINSIKVFDGYIYTCSNDFTARRFYLKDISETVIYHHKAKDVLQLSVQMIKKITYVFTLCSKRWLSLFHAEDGILLKTYCQSRTVMCICKGWGMFYAGFINGCITVYRNMEEHELVETEGHIMTMASANQGRLHVLIILSAKGHIDVRDAETGLLIHYLHVLEARLAQLVVQNHLAYLSSSEKVISVLDFMTGTLQERFHLTQPIICLAVYKNYVLTIEVDRLVHSYHQRNGKDVKYYGAGGGDLTYIHVYRGWVFTGNKNGQLSVFKFDPCIVLNCQFTGCNLSFGSQQDLVFHLEKDHCVPKKGTKCPWGSCDFVFPREWDERERVSHIIKKDIAECVSSISCHCDDA